MDRLRTQNAGEIVTGQECAHKFFSRHHRFDRGEQFAFSVGLDDVTESTGVESRERYIEIKVLADEKNLGFRGKPANFRGGLDAAQLRQVDIHENKIGMQLGCF